MRSIYYILLIITPSLVSGQDVKPVSKKKADNYFSYEIYQYALPTYLDLLKKDPENGELNLKAGICLLNSPKKSESISFLERAVIAGEISAYFYMGQILHYEGMFDEAIQNYLIFKQRASILEYLAHDVDRHLAITLRAQQMIRNPVKVQIENLGPEINSSYADYVPVLSADESLLIFTSRREGTTGSEKDQYGDYYEDLYYSLKSGGKWSEARNMGVSINTPSHDASVSLSADGQNLIIYRMNKGFYGGDLYLSVLDGKTWTQPHKIEGEINSPYWEPSACLSPNQKTLFFSSNRPGGYGGRDIYMSHKLPDGTWGIPINLGAIINTPYDDDAPFMHPNGKTLFFSSKGHQTMGGFDIFKATMMPNDLWSLPENVGYPINTVDDDIYFVLSADGKRGYYSSDKEGGFGDKDIYMIELAEEEMALTVVKGLVMEAGSVKPVGATITVIDELTKNVQGIYHSNSATGKYLLVLPPEKTFKVVVEAEGYHAWSGELKVNSEEEFYEIQEDIVLIPNETSTNKHAPSRVKKGLESDRDRAPDHKKSNIISEEIK